MSELRTVLLIAILFPSVSYCSDLHPKNIVSDSISETASYYKNGNIRSRTRTFYDRFRQVEFKTVYEKFRKSGGRLYVVVMDYPLILTYKAVYDPDGLLVVQKFYTYNREGALIQIETRSDGISTFQTFDD